MARSLLSIRDFTSEEIEELFDLAARIKAAPGEFRNVLDRKQLGMIFQKSSTRTRVSFEVAMAQLGGAGLFLSSRDLQLGRGETIADTARVLSRYLDGIMARTYAHEDVIGLAEYADIPVINGLTDRLHPCQGLTDAFTILEEKGSFDDLKVTYIGDGNNVAHSLLNAAARLGFNLALTCPEGYMPDNAIVDRAIEEGTGAIEMTHDPNVGLSGADVVYTDTWASMGQEEERLDRLRIFQAYQVNEETMGYAKDDAIFMHCLPVHRGEEATDEVCDGPQSVIFDQAENRLHVQKAILITLMGD